MFKEENKLFNKIKEKIGKEEKLNSILKSFHNTQIELPIEQILDGNYELLDGIEKKSGLYYVEIKQISNDKISNDKTWNDKTWNDLKNKWDTIKHIPKVTNRWEKHEYNQNEFFPFYIGKTAKSINERVHQHVFCTKKDGNYNVSTSALRLKEHYENDDIKNTMKCFLFRVSYISLEIESELLQLLESNIRERENCMVGKN